MAGTLGRPANRKFDPARKNKGLDGELDEGTVSGPSEPSVQAVPMLHAGPYLKLAEVMYLAQIPFELLSAVAALSSSQGIFALLTRSTVVSAAITLLLSVAWVQLGRRQSAPWFVAAGVFGGASVTLVLVNALVLGPSYSLVAQGETVVTLVYFAMQLAAFYTSSKIFHVRLFWYAAVLLIIGFVTPFTLDIALTVGRIVLSVNQIAGVVYGVGLIISAASSLAAALGFHLAGRSLLARSTEPAAEGTAYSAEPPVPG